MDTKVADAEYVLKLLRRLSPREQLQVVLRALPELAEALPDTPIARDFWQATDIDALVATQGISPVTDFETLLGGWPEDESLDPFLDELHT